MNRISRFFTPKKTPASDKATAGKKDASKASVKKDAAGGGGPSSFDSMEDAPHRDQKNGPASPTAASKISNATSPTDGAHPAPKAPRPKGAAALRADAAFDSHYGSAQQADAAGAPTVAKRFNDTVDVEMFRFARYAEEQPHIKGDVAKLYDLALQRNEPVLLNTEKSRIMVWPSGHTYTGAFEKKSLKPGPMGILTLPSGEEVKASFQKGSCYHAVDFEGKVIRPNLEKVVEFHSINKI